jgi:2-dehydro-3-deoxy-D-arabinonate dehydratase
MQVARVELSDGSRGIAVIDGGALRVADARAGGPQTLSELLHAADPVARAREIWERAKTSLRTEDARFLAPIDDQEVWGAGVTYKRSQVARREESKEAGSFYDRVYTADRPELFLKATPSRVVGPGQNVRLRGDTRWCVPEPELALVLNPRLDIVGYTIGDDVSCRDIEGENPLYLPQAKCFGGCCALGPAVTLTAFMPPRAQIGIRLKIERDGRPAYTGTTTVAEMARPLEELVSWLGRDQDFSSGVILLSGTGIVPPDDFSLEPGDRIAIQIDGIGTLTTGVERRTGSG